MPCSGAHFDFDHKHYPGPSRYRDSCICATAATQQWAGDGEWAQRWQGISMTHMLCSVVVQLLITAAARAMRQ
jgi:hypothetical protein